MNAWRMVVVLTALVFAFAITECQQQPEPVSMAAWIRVSPAKSDLAVCLAR